MYIYIYIHTKSKREGEGNVSKKNNLLKEYFLNGQMEKSHGNG